MFQRFAKTIFSATQGCNIVPILFRVVTTFFQHCNAVLRWKSSLWIVPCNITLKQHRRRRLRLRKRHWKSKFALFQTLPPLFHLIQFVKSWQFFLELNSKRLYRSSGKEKESPCLVFKSSEKREIGHLHIVVVQWLQLRTWCTKSVMHVKSCCFANLKVMLHETIRNDDF